MRRRQFLQPGSVAAIEAWEETRPPGQELQAQYPTLETELIPEFSSAAYVAPDWLRTARGVYFDGYSPPIYPHLKNFDAQRLVETVLELGGDSLRFQPTGYFASYPTEAFPVHEELNGRDLIDEVTRECRRAGVHVYCYLPYGAPGMLRSDYLKAHPKYTDWVLRDPEGRQYGTYENIGWGSLQRYCTTGTVYRDALRQIVREYCAHDIEGIYFDAPSAFGYSGICFCQSCRGEFQRFSGISMDRLASLAKLNGLPFDWNGSFPASVAVDMEALTAWYSWANQLTREDLLDFRKIIHGGDKFMLCHNAQSWIGTSLPMQYRIPDGFMMESSREIYDRLATGMMGSSMARPYKKVAQMYLGSYAVSWFHEPPHVHPWETHNTSEEDSDEIRLEGFADLACGNAPLYATANRIYFKVGSGSEAPAREVFDLMKRAEPIFRDSVPASNIAILTTWESQQRWRQRSKSWNWLTMSGAMGLVLLDQRISFDINPSTEMSDAWLARQKVIALCGASGISDETGNRLAAWVAQGGGLLATYDSGLYDSMGQQRQDGGALREVLGVRMKAPPLESEPECYYRIREDHASLGAYKPEAIIEGDGTLVPVETTGEARVIAECWNLGTDEVRGPAIVANRYGRGRAIYIAGSLEANYLYDRTKSSRELLGGIVEYLGDGAPQPYKLNAPRGVYGVLRRTACGDLTLWLLANVGFKDASSGRMRQEYVTVSDIQVSILLPEGRRAKHMQLLRSGRPISYKIEGEYAVAKISLHIAEVVYLELQQ
jgi:hypothetical protein